MIARLRGRLDGVGVDSIVVDVGGVGYLVHCSHRTLGDLPRLGEAIQLEIETHVREDHIHLYGFLSGAERDWFRLLTTVQGVGARVALAILSALGPDALTTAIAAQDRAAVARANGVGPKLAARIVSELKDRVGAAASFPAVHAAAGPPVQSPADDAVSALVNLGYGRSEAFAAVSRAVGGLDEAAKLDEIVRAGLRELAQ